jgi:hypothetical protein
LLPALLFTIFTSLSLLAPVGVPPILKQQGDIFRVSEHQHNPFPPSNDGDTPFRYCLGQFLPLTIISLIQFRMLCLRCEFVWACRGADGAPGDRVSGRECTLVSLLTACRSQIATSQTGE